MTNRAFEILQRRYHSRVSAWVFPNSTNGNPIDPQNFYNRVYLPALEAAGIEGMTWHCLRKTFASRLALAGTSIQKIQSVLGVSDTKVVERYAHLLPDTFRGTIEPLNRPKPDRGGLRVVK